MKNLAKCYFENQRPELFRPGFKKNQQVHEPETRPVSLLHEISESSQTGLDHKQKDCIENSLAKLLLLKTKCFDSAQITTGYPESSVTPQHTASKF